MESRRNPGISTRHVHVSLAPSATSPEPHPKLNPKPCKPGTLGPKQKFNVKEDGHASKSSDDAPALQKDLGFRDYAYCPYPVALVSPTYMYDIVIFQL